MLFISEILHDLNKQISSSTFAHLSNCKTYVFMNSSIAESKPRQVRGWQTDMGGRGRNSLRNYANSKKTKIPSNRRQSKLLKCMYIYILMAMLTSIPASNICFSSCCCCCSDCCCCCCCCAWARRIANTFARQNCENAKSKQLRQSWF